jgi:hypothetical protein
VVLRVTGGEGGDIDGEGMVEVVFVVFVVMLRVAGGIFVPTERMHETTACDCK